MGSKESIVGPSTPNHECCMCGDYGLRNELFRCSVCLLRSQHRYCSSLYPKTQSYKVCNWCLNKDGGKKEQGTQNLSLSSTCNNNNIQDQDEEYMKKTKNKSSTKGNGHVVLNKPIMEKQKSSSDQLSVGRKKIIASDGRAEESLRRMKSEEMTNMKRRKQVCKVKVRRYKLLEEVSRQ